MESEKQPGVCPSFSFVSHEGFFFLLFKFLAVATGQRQLLILPFSLQLRKTNLFSETMYL